MTFAELLAATHPTIDPARGTVVLVPVHLAGDPSLSPELWLIPAGDKPHSLGMIKRGEAMVVDIPHPPGRLSPRAT